MFCCLLTDEDRLRSWFLSINIWLKETLVSGDEIERGLCGYIELLVSRD
jgi:hypothetical protein